ncbi:nucleotide-binding protein [Carboxylicivirga linearis]|uniref:P-loop NTPase n=1 Tax=Carboxylicivirga linearis TaxID=1628157 RepID=A0ABS5JX00_9BACT|nr:P-loop NTPase [Carboxylicivirga linearis]MBS2099343.1 P-loop NTPase [Carboxylicivirga linearis]
MPIKIAVASGKGGTGKTTVTVTLFHYIKENITSKVQIADCDVEEPNSSIFFDDLKPIESKEVLQMIPSINTDRCSFCKKCVDYCEFNATVVIPGVGFAEVNSALCHSCGACLYACPEDALTEKSHAIGQLIKFGNNQETPLIEGKLKVGSAMQTMVINHLVNDDWLNGDIILYDAPPGTSCSVVSTVSQANYIILVTEPTPFGLHDLKLMIELVRKLNKPFGVIINKADKGFEETNTYLMSEGIEILAEIPFRVDYASSYAQGSILKNIPGDINAAYSKLISNLKNKWVHYA